MRVADAAEWSASYKNFLNSDYIVSTELQRNEKATVRAGNWNGLHKFDTSMWEISHIDEHYNLGEDRTNGLCKLTF